MAHETFHVPIEKLTDRTKRIHYAIASLMEELEAVDWYYQRADDTDDGELKAILLHNAHEEIEHACMVLEWLRRADDKFNENLREYLFQEGSIVGREQEVEGKPTDQD
jgi:ferritin-like protein